MSSFYIGDYFFGSMKYCKQAKLAYYKSQESLYTFYVSIFIQMHV